MRCWSAAYAVLLVISAYLYYKALVTIGYQSIDLFEIFKASLTCRAGDSEASLGFSQPCA